MNKMDVFRQAVAEIGDVPSETLCQFIEAKFGVTIEPRYIPLFRASLRDWEQLHRKRQAAKSSMTIPQNVGS
jgi:hypothetical protein